MSSDYILKIGGRRGPERFRVAVPVDLRACEMPDSQYDIAVFSGNQMAPCFLLYQ